MSRTGRIAAGRTQVQPDGRFFRVPTAPRRRACPRPDGARVVLELQRFTGGAFRTVARAATADGTARLTAQTSAGAYRYRVVGLSGSGEYTLAFSAR
nr:hypothetical protein [Micromonospora provocatoris]